MIRSAMIRRATLLLASLLLVGIAEAQTDNSRTQTPAKSVYAELGKVPAKAAGRHNPLEADPEAVAAGGKLFEQHCAECHGERLVNPGPSFDLRKLSAGERARFDASVTEGKGQMPAWAGVLDAQQMDQLWAYIRSKAD